MSDKKTEGFNNYYNKFLDEHVTNYGIMPSQKIAAFNTWNYLTEKHEKEVDMSQIETYRHLESLYVSTSNKLQAANKKLELLTKCTDFCFDDCFNDICQGCKNQKLINEFSGGGE